MWDRIIFLILDLIIVFLLIWMTKKMRKVAISNKSQAREYGKSVVIGIVAGIVVLVLDRLVPPIFENLPELNLNSLGPFFVSLIDGLIMLFFEFGLVILICLYIIYQGISKLSSK